MWRVVIPGQPAAQARPRFANGRAYRAGRSVQWETAASFVMLERWEAEFPPGAKTHGPVSAEMIFVFKRPGRIIWKTRQMPRAPHDRKPDLDNCVKSLNDGIPQAIVSDDSRITRIVASKWYASGDETPHVELVLRWSESEETEDAQRKVVEGKS